MNNFVNNLIAGEPLYVQVTCTLLIGLCTVIVSLATAIIAYMQWQTNEKKTRMDLFEERYNHLYIPLNAALDSMTRNTYKENPDLFIKNSEDFFKELNKYSFFMKEKDSKILIDTFTKYYKEVIRVGELPQEEAVKSLEKYLNNLTCYRKTMYDLLTKYLRIEK